MRYLENIVLGLILVLTLVNCGGSNNSKDENKVTEDFAVITTDFGEMTIEFYPEAAPKHVESFKLLAKEGYFDSTTFHRVKPGFVIQGGDPNSKDDDRANDGQGGHAGKFYGVWDFSKAPLMKDAVENPDSWLLPAEFNEIQHERGMLSMARSQDPHSAGSQFFICVDATPQLDKKYTVFGKVISGIEVADQIVGVKTPKKQDPKYRQSDGDNPLEPIRMQVRIESRSVDISEVQ